MTTEHFRLGQYVRIGYRAWINQNGGPVADKRAIDQLEADYRAMQPRTNGTGQRPLPVYTPHSAPHIERPVRKSRRESETRNGKV